MQIVIDIPNKDIPKHQEVIDIHLHFIDGHIVDADGYGFMELPKGHWILIDENHIKAEIEKQEKWLLQAGYSAYNADIAFDAIKAVIAEMEG